jgi:hypothetical protein
MADSLLIMPFGKHKGCPIEDLETSYLEWLTEQDWFIEKFELAAEQVGKELAFRNRFGGRAGGDPNEDRNWNRRNKSGRDNF